MRRIEPPLHRTVNATSPGSDRSRRTGRPPAPRTGFVPASRSGSAAVSGRDGTALDRACTRISSRPRRSRKRTARRPSGILAAFPGGPRSAAPSPLPWLRTPATPPTAGLPVAGSRLRLQNRRVAAGPAPRGIRTATYPAPTRRGDRQLRGRPRFAGLRRRDGRSPARSLPRRPVSQLPLRRLAPRRGRSPVPPVRGAACEDSYHGPGFGSGPSRHPLRLRSRSRQLNPQSGPLASVCELRVSPMKGPALRLPWLRATSVSVFSRLRISIAAPPLP